MHVNITLYLKLCNAYAALRVILLCSEAHRCLHTNPTQFAEDTANSGLDINSYTIYIYVYKYIFIVI